MPTHDAMFGDIFYILNMPLTIAASIPKAIGYKMILHIILAGVFFFLLLRRGFQMPAIIASTGAVFYMFNPQFVSHIYPGHDAKMYVIAWLPFIIWQLKSLFEKPTLLTSALLGLGIGMSLFTSHIQMTYFMLWGAFLYWATATGIGVYTKEAMTRTLLKSAYFWVAVIFGLGIAAIQIFPSFLYIRDAFSVRGTDRGFDFAASWSLHWPEVFSLWVPEFCNSLQYYWGQNAFKLNSEYAGMIPVIFAAIAIISKPKNPWRIFWGAVACGAVLFALAANTPFFTIAYYLVPGVKKFRAASMIMFWFSFSTILLSALALKDLVNGYYTSLTEISKKKWYKGLPVAMAVLGAVTLLFSMQGAVKELFAGAITSSRQGEIFAANFSKNFVPFLWLWFVFTLALLGSFLAVIKNKLSVPVFMGIVLTVAAIDLVRTNLPFIQLASSKQYFYKEPALVKLGTEMREAPFRCFSLPGTFPSQNGEGIHGLEGVGGFHDNELHWYREFRGDQQDRNFISSLIGMNDNGQPYLKSEMLSEGNPFLNIANAKYLLVRNGYELLAIENRNALGRLSFAKNIVVMDSSKVPEALSRGEYDYRTTIAVSKAPEALQNPVPATGKAFAVSWKKYATNYRKAVVTVPENGYLRISEVYYPGWKMLLDGKPVQFFRADLAWMGIAIPAGEHTLEMQPQSLYLNRFIPVSAVTAGVLLLIFLGAGVTAAKNRKRS